MSHSQLIVLSVCTPVTWPGAEDKDAAGGSARPYGLIPHLWSEARPAVGWPVKMEQDHDSHTRPGLSPENLKVLGQL